MKKALNRMSYKGKTVCVGIDVHKKTYSVVAVVEGEVVKKWRTAANSVSFADQLRRYFWEAKVKTVYEAGFSGFVLHRELEKAGIESIVVNPASIEVAANNRVKTDKRDALKMATLLEAGRLKGIRIPTQEEEQSRLLTRTRQQLVEQRTSLKNQIRMKFHLSGINRCSRGKSPYSSIGRRVIREINITIIAARCLCITECLEKYRSRNQKD